MTHKNYTDTSNTITHDIHLELTYSSVPFILWHYSCMTHFSVITLTCLLITMGVHFKRSLFIWIWRRMIMLHVEKLWNLGVLLFEFQAVHMSNYVNSDSEVCLLFSLHHPTTQAWPTSWPHYCDSLQGGNVCVTVSVCLCLCVCVHKSLSGVSL